MLQKTFIVFLLLLISIFCLAGCKKSSEPIQPTAEDYKAKAREQITTENMADELENIEKAMDQELSEPE